jgi:putative transposase
MPGGEVEIDPPPLKLQELYDGIPAHENDEVDIVATLNRDPVGSLQLKPRAASMVSGEDHLHKLSARLVGQYEAICVEALAVAALAKTKLGKSVLDTGWGQLRFQLSYNACWKRKHLVAIGRFFPSSRLCGACGAINGELTLAGREWTCGCGAFHDRDLNAARNLRHEGLRLLLAGGTSES